MGKFGAIQQQMEDAKKQLNSKLIDVEVEGGAIKITVNGNKKITNIQINDSLMTDKEALEDLLLTAVNKALDKAETFFDDEMKNVAKGVIPGMF